ncbi:MAG: sigma-70 family RNA polymerase sigma factor [Thermodesulfobacteriota bacterium]
MSAAQESSAPDEPDEPDESTELVRAVRRGDNQAFNRLVLLYQNRIFSLALNYVKDEEEARDLAQDIFVTAFRALDKLRDETKFGAWLYQIGLNHCRNRYKRLNRRGFFTNKSLDDPTNPVPLSSGTSPEEELEKQRIVNKVRSTIATMNEVEKEILILRDLQGLPYEEISEIMAIPLGTVKSKLNRARHGLKKKLKIYHDQL